MDGWMYINALTVHDVYILFHYWGKKFIQHGYLIWRKHAQYCMYCLRERERGILSLGLIFRNLVQTSDSTRLLIFTFSTCVFLVSAISHLLLSNRITVHYQSKITLQFIIVVLGVCLCDSYQNVLFSSSICQSITVCIYTAETTYGTKQTKLPQLLWPNNTNLS